MITVGVVARPHGLRGEIAVTLYDPDSKTLLGIEQVQVGAETCRVRKARTGRRGQIVLDLGLTLEEAEKRRGLDVAVDEGELPPLQAWEFWHHDLLGLTAVDVEGRELGKVEEVVDTADIAVLVVRGEKGEVFVPLVDPYLLEIDVPGGKVKVAPPEE